MPRNRANGTKETHSDMENNTDAQAVTKQWIGFSTVVLTPLVGTAVKCGVVATNSVDTRRGRENILACEMAR